MTAKYIITEFNNRKTGFLLEDGKLVRACFLSNESNVGNIYTAKVMNIVPSINAAFIDAGTGDRLYYSLTDNDGMHIFLKHGNTNKLCVGDEILVQISMDPIKTKKGVATSIIEMKGKNIILRRNGSIGVSKKFTDQDRKKLLKDKLQKLISEEDSSFGKVGAVIRTAGNDATDEEVVDEFKQLLSRAEGIYNSAINSVVKKCIYKAPDGFYDELEEITARGKYEEFGIVTDSSFEYDHLAEIIDKKYLELYSDDNLKLYKLYSIEDKLKKCFNRTIYLKSGGSIVVEPTEALTVIDVNTGKAIKGKNVQKTFLKINLEAATEIARILRLRNMSGIIIIDFINLKSSEDIKELINHLKVELSKDEKRVTYVDMTSLGLVELTRVKGERPLTLSDFE